MSINPQSQSAFVTRLVTLAPEIRDAIYLEMWRSCGLRQHILWHGEKPATEHLCRWPCTTEYEVEDGVQREVEELRCRLGIPLGEDMVGDLPGDSEVAVQNRRLKSPWMNHWACGEQAREKHGHKAVWGANTSQLVCWRKNRAYQTKEHVPSWSPYLPMLLSCKLLSEQCLKSIYESTTFIFTDMRAIQFFFGHCLLPPAAASLFNIPTTPPGFYKYARTLELSLSTDFPGSLICANFKIPGLEHRHEVYDFHWLHLDRLQNLHTLNIWISARASTVFLRDSAETYNYTGITELDADTLQQVMASLGRVATLTLSTPLGPSVGPEQGFVDGVKARVYKRGSGDRFHPPMHPTEPVGTFDGIIHTSPTREVRLARNRGTYILMKKV